MAHRSAFDAVGGPGNQDLEQNNIQEPDSTAESGHNNGAEPSQQIDGAADSSIEIQLIDLVSDSDNEASMRSASPVPGPSGVGGAVAGSVPAPADLGAPQSGRGLLELLDLTGGRNSYDNETSGEFEFGSDLDDGGAHGEPSGAPLQPDLSEALSIQLPDSDGEGNNRDRDPTGSRPQSRSATPTNSDMESGRGGGCGEEDGGSNGDGDDVEGEDGDDGGDDDCEVVYEEGCPCTTGGRVTWGGPDDLNLMGTIIHGAMRRLRGMDRRVMLPVGGSARGVGLRPRLIIAGSFNMQAFGLYASGQGDVAEGWEIVVSGISLAQDYEENLARIGGWLVGLAPVPGEVVILEAMSAPAWNLLPGHPGSDVRVPRAADGTSVRAACTAIRDVLGRIRSGVRVIALGPLPVIGGRGCRNPVGICTPRRPATSPAMMRYLHSIDCVMRRLLRQLMNVAIYGANDLVGLSVDHADDIGHHYRGMIGDDGLVMSMATMRVIANLAVGDFTRNRAAETRREGQ